MLFNEVISDLSDVCDDAHKRFMHPAASGNVSVKLDDLPPSTECSEEEWQNFDASLPNLAGEKLLISTSGSKIGHVAKHTEKALGVIEFDKTGNAFRKLWGFKGYSEKPTSELDTHARIQNVAPGTVIHNHPLATNSLMLAGVIKDSETANKALWQGTTEGVAYLPGGLEVLPWCVPGTKEIGEDTARALEKGADAVLWHRHGLVANGKTVEAAYDKVLTIEHAMIGVQMALAAASSDQIQWLKKQQLSQLVNKFELSPRENVWNNLHDWERDLI